MSLLKVNNLGKAFRTYQSEWHRFANWFGIRIKPSEEHWVLKHVSFDIHPGEAIGIIGQNGAGKSTLLKMITGTLQPTEGQVQVNGRIAAILELGMGFNPELTGRQNVFHAAGLMGFTAEQIQQAMPDIEAFAEIGEYFDEPVRIYSSGMQVRVAFSVATAYRPEILIVDEALSVGDAYFQHKSFKRICEYREQGTSLLIVSHDKSAIQSLCDKAIFLNEGEIELSGKPEYVLDYYNALTIGNDSSEIRTTKTKKSNKKIIVSGNDYAAVEDICLLDSKGRIIEVVNVGQKIEIQITVRVLHDVHRLILGYMIKDRIGQEVFGINTHITKQELINCIVDDVFIFRITFIATLGAGSYSISTSLVDTTSTHIVDTYEWNELSAIFEVVNYDKPHFAGTTWMSPVITVEKL